MLLVSRAPIARADLTRRIAPSRHSHRSATGSVSTGGSIGDQVCELRAHNRISDQQPGSLEVKIPQRGRVDWTKPSEIYPPHGVAWPTVRLLLHFGARHCARLKTS